VLLAESCETLLLGDGVDVGADDEGHDVEEGNPELVREELLGKSQADRRGDPRDPHHLPEADLDGSTNLMVGASAGDEGHSNEIDAVLDRSDLGVVLATGDTKLGPSNLAQVAFPSFLRMWTYFNRLTRNLIVQACSIKPSISIFKRARTRQSRNIVQNLQ
jgi:hypothetical protein